MTLRPPLDRDQMELDVLGERRNAELLIRKAKRRQRRRRSLTVAFLLAAVLGIASSFFVMRFNKVATANATSVGGFIASMKSAEATGYVATYHVKNFSFFQNGTINFAQVPSPRGTKAVENADGYSGTGKFSYVFYGSSDHVIRQWIIVNTNVQACVKWSWSHDKNLVCGRPGPYIPSNGYAEEGMGLLPPYVANVVESNLGNGTVQRLSTKSSRQFGPLRCLTQNNSSSLTTCIDRTGYVVSWKETSNTAFSPSMTLIKLSHQPTMRDFSPLVKPTVAFVLPPV